MKALEPEINQGREVFMLRTKRLVFIISILTICGLGFRSYDSIRKYVRMTYSIATTAKAQVVYSGPVAATAVGKAAIGISAQSTSFDTQMIIFLGRLTVKGKMIPAATGTPVPSKLRITVKHNGAGGNTIATDNYDVNVQSDGTILQQNLAVTNFQVYSVKDTIQVYVTPLDRPLPAGRLTLSLTHSMGSLDAGKEPLQEAAPSATPQLIYAYTNYVEDRALNGTLGPYVLKALGQPGFNLNGTIRINGKITPYDPEPLPSAVSVNVKYKDARNGKVLSAQNFTIKIQANGQILLQSFPFTTFNDTGTPESVEVTAKPVGKPFPYSLVSARLTYTPATQ